MKKSTFILIIILTLSLTANMFLIINRTKTNKQQESTNEKTTYETTVTVHEETETRDHASELFEQHFNSFIRRYGVSIDDCLEILKKAYSDGDGANDDELKKICIYSGIDKDGYGVCLFNYTDEGMHQSYCITATTTNSGESWEISKNIFTTSSHPVSFTIINKTFYVVTYIAVTLYSDITTYSIPDLEEQNRCMKDIYPEELKETHWGKLSEFRVMANLVSQTDSTFTLAWTMVKRNEDYRYNDATEDDIFYIAEYDEDFNTIAIQYKNTAIIDELVSARENATNNK